MLLAHQCVAVGIICVVGSAALWHRHAQIASFSMIAGALCAIGFSSYDWLYPAYELGNATVAANQATDTFTIGVELGVLLLALASLIPAQRWKKTFWLAWAINLFYVLYWIAAIIWLNFFWHW